MLHIPPAGFFAQNKEMRKLKETNVKMQEDCNKTIFSKNTEIEDYKFKIKIRVFNEI